MAEWPKWVWDEDFLNGTPEEQLAEEVRNASAGVLPDDFDPRYMHSEVIPADLGRELVTVLDRLLHYDLCAGEKERELALAVLARYKKEVGDA